MSDEAPGIVYVIVTDDDQVKFLGHILNSNKTETYKAALEAGYQEGTFRVLPMEYLKFPRQ